MKKSPQEIVFSLSNQLKGLDEGETITLRRLNESTGHHYVTIKAYVELIKFVQTIMPAIALSTDGKGEMVVKVERKAILPLDEPGQLLLYLLDHNGYREINAIEIPSRFRGLIGKMENKVALSGQKAYLTKDGLISAVEISEKREELVSDSIGHQFSDVQNMPMPEEIENPGLEVIELSESYQLFEVAGRAQYKKDSKRFIGCQNLVGAA